MEQKAQLTSQVEVVQQLLTCWEAGVLQLVVAGQKLAKHQSQARQLSGLVQD